MASTQIDLSEQAPKRAVSIQARRHVRRLARSGVEHRLATGLRSGLVLSLFLVAAPAALTQVTFQHGLVDADGPGNMHVKAVGDLNGDGFADLVIAGTGGEVYWYEERSAHPAWTRRTLSASGLGGWSTDAECGDLDGDGDTDLFISDWYQVGRVGWFENVDGLGTTWSFHPIGGPRAHDIELADFDGDGDLDAVTRQQGQDGKPLELWRNDGASGWTHGSYTPPGAKFGEGLHAADIDGDGDPDLVLGDAWYENLGGAFPNGSWSEHGFAGVPVDPETVPFTGDLNGDGRLDIVTTPSELAGGSGETRWFQAPLDPRSTPWPTVLIDTTETVTHSLAVGDMDLDGDLDVVTAEMVQGANPDEVRVYLNDDGAGGAWTILVVSTIGSHSLRVVDVGGDGDLDIFGANWTGTVQVDIWENELNDPLIGQAFCVGDACPCDNDGGAGEGCANATGEGATLVGTGSPSVTADDLRLVESHLPPSTFGVIVMADGEASQATTDGHMCVGGNLFRFPARQSGAEGTIVEGPGMVAYAAANLPSAGEICPGSTWRFQGWYRDSMGPCGSGSNWSAGLSVTFIP